MRDEDFSYFIEKFGEATSSITVPDKSIEKWQRVLPDTLLTYWKTEGWGTYLNGLFSLVDPDKYKDLLDIWLEGTQFEEMDSYHVIARSAFGHLYVFGESTGNNTVITPAFNQIIHDSSDCKRKKPAKLNSEIQSFFAASDLKDYDLIDSSDNYLFDKVVKKFGALAPTEIFGLEPAYVLGGDIELKNLRKLDCQIHLTILRELASPQIISF